MNDRPDVIIRPLNDADVPKILDFFDGLSQTSRDFYHPYAFDQNAVSQIAEQLGNQNCAHIGAFHGDGDGQKMVGHVWYIGREGGSRPGLGIGIVDAFHNRGIGQRLMKRIEEVARARGERGIELTCYLENCRAIHVYTKRGYRVVGKTTDGDQFRMVRDFADNDL